MSVNSLPYCRLIRENKYTRPFTDALQTSVFPFSYWAKWISGPSRTWRVEYAAGFFGNGGSESPDNRIPAYRLRRRFLKTVSISYGDNSSADGRRNIDEQTEYNFRGPCLFLGRAFFEGGVLRGTCWTRIFGNIASSLARFGCLQVARNLYPFGGARLRLPRLVNMLNIIGG